MASLENDLSEFNRLVKVTAKAYDEMEVSNTTLAEYYVKCGEACEIAGVPKQQICALVRQNIEQELKNIHKDKPELAEAIAFHSGHYYRVMDARGWKRTYTLADGTVDNAETDSPHGENEEGSDSLNSFRDRTNAPYYSIRYPYWKFFKDLMDISKRCKEVLEQDEQLVENSDGTTEHIKINWTQLFETKQDMQDYYKALGDMFYGINKVSEKCVDGRQAILPFMLFPFVAKTALTTIKHFSTKYFVKIKYLPDITTKKCTQFLKAENSKSELLSLTKVDPWLWNSIDIKCPECRKHEVDGKPVTSYLQTKMYPNGTWDFVCTKWKIHKQDEMHFNSDLLDHKLNMLSMNSSNMAERYSKERGID